ncbi:hypothetical protein Vadar_013947 [Vaccinium darrowii]|uniref:Uncharacterized protein n=1 Tax=Vaccinium darrowii TaxID=229202 RepID=A0ACB7X0M6_9ERIC|nr:hypothetical protein Vadar_013947 [Vaccinium darrowii]
MVDLRCMLYVHVGGKIVKGNQIEYVKGVKAECKVDPDSFSYYDLLETIKDTGYYGQKDSLSLSYTKPMCDMDTGLVQLTSHDEMLHMFAEFSGNKYMVIDVYVHCPNLVESDEEDDIGRDTTVVDQGCLTEVGVDLEVRNGDELGGVDEDDGGVVGDEDQAVQSMDEDKESFDEEHEENTALVGFGKNNLGGGDEQGAGDSDNDDNCLVEDSDDDGKSNFPEFKETLMNKPQLVEGMKFPNVMVFRKLLREYHIKEGYTFKFVKNESKRVTVVCARNCGFRLHASPMYEERSFQIKKINQQHECTRVYTNNNATSSWLSQKYLTKLSDAPETKVKSMKKIVRKEWLLNVSHHKVHRAKRKALELIQGDHTEQYLWLWDYCEMLRRQNPGSVAKLKVDRPWEEHGPIFRGCSYVMMHV